MQSCSACELLETLRVNQSLLAAFKALFVSDPSHEGRGSVLENKSVSFSFKFSYNWTSSKASVELT